MAYHRKESPTQTVNIASLQEASLEVWGKEPQGSSILTVQAYKRRLPNGDRGIEFDTHVPPNPDGHPFYASWSGERPGIFIRQADGQDFAAIVVINFQNKQPPLSEGSN
jgi:hypothetical protein